MYLCVINVLKIFLCDCVMDCYKSHLCLCLGIKYLSTFLVISVGKGHVHIIQIICIYRNISSTKQRVLSVLFTVCILCLEQCLGHVRYALNILKKIVLLNSLDLAAMNI